MPTPCPPFQAASKTTAGPKSTIEGVSALRPPNQKTHMVGLWPPASGHETDSGASSRSGRRFPSGSRMVRGGSRQSGRSVFGDPVPAQKTVPGAAASIPRLHPAAEPRTHAKSTRPARRPRGGLPARSPLPPLAPEDRGKRNDDRRTGAEHHECRSSMHGGHRLRHLTCPTEPADLSAHNRCQTTATSILPPGRRRNNRPDASRGLRDEIASGP